MGSIACLCFAACALSRRRVIQCGGPCSTDCSLGRGFCKRSQVFVSAWPLRVIDLGRRVEQYERFTPSFRPMLLRLKNKVDNLQWPNRELLRCVRKSMILQQKRKQDMLEEESCGSGAGADGEDDRLPADLSDEDVDAGAAVAAAEGEVELERDARPTSESTPGQPG